MDLTPDERAALAELEWLASGPHTLDEIGERLGLCRERVRVLERQAIRKLQRAAMRADLEADMFRAPAMLVAERPRAMR